MVVTAAVLGMACATPRDVPMAMPGTGGSGVSGGAVDASQGTSPGMGGSGPAAGVANGFGCVEGATCTPADMPCMSGLTRCDRANQTCVATDKRQANGTVCGSSSVCSDGACSACMAGVPCPLPDSPCRAGVIDCSGGKPVCMDSANAANGKSCGAGMVCSDGMCVTCATGGKCLPANPCHQGTLDCANGQSTCVDMNSALAAGESCGPNMVCNSGGQCTACTAGQPCTTTDPCKMGKIACSSGAPVCMTAGNAANGTACGNGMVCSEGSCVACQTGMVCVPDNKCHTGSLSCTTGQAECKDTSNNLPNGTSCGTNMVCSGGQCNACTDGTGCTPANPCRTGKTSCATGTSICMEVANVANGKACGAGQVCSNGTCVACDAGAACNAGDPCKKGTISCASGAPICTATNLPNGTSCPGAGDKIGTCNNGGCALACPKNQNDCGSNRCATCCTQCCGDGDCRSDQTCSGGTCHALSCSQCETVGTHKCNAKDRFSPCSGGYCDGGACKGFVGSGKACTDARECGNGICGAAESGRVCCKSTCDTDSLCNKSGDCRFKDGVSCSANSATGNNECLHACINSCDGPPPVTGGICVTDAQCVNGETCLQDSPTCGKLP
jgi:hypothetical protein